MISTSQRLSFLAPVKTGCLKTIRFNKYAHCLLTDDLLGAAARHSWNTSTSLYGEVLKHFTFYITVRMTKDTLEINAGMCQIHGC